MGRVTTSRADLALAIRKWNTARRKFMSYPCWQNRARLTDAERHLGKLAAQLRREQGG